MMTMRARSSGLAIRTVFAVLALTCTALPAMAADDDVPEFAVSFSDLDVSREPGAVVLYRRISLAARSVCSNLDRADLSSKQRFKTCVNKAVDAAVTSVNKPAVFAVYQAKRGASRLSVASLESQQVSEP